MLYLFYMLSYILPIKKMTTYPSVILFWYVVSMISCFREKPLRLKQTPSKVRIIGICRQHMILSAYIISWKWMGYLKKIGRAPNIKMIKFHQIGISVVLLVIILLSIVDPYEGSLLHLFRIHNRSGKREVQILSA